MTTVANAGSSRPRLRPRGFYVVMGIAVTTVVAAGFGRSYLRALAPPGLPFWVHIHGAAMAAWVGLFVAQSALIERGSFRLHRKLGVAGAGLAAAIVPLGVATTILCVRRGAVPPFFTPAQMLAADLVDLAVFASLVAAAIVLRARGEWHKRLMLIATIALLGPATARLLPLMALRDRLWSVLAAGTLALIGAAMIYDLVTRERVHPAYWIGFAALIAVGYAPPLVAQTGILESLASAAAT